MSVAGDGTAFEVVGPVDAPVVVLVHGLGLNRACWQWAVPALSDRYRVVSYDIYGHGQSAAPPETPSLALFSRQLTDLLDHLQVSRAAIVGFSLGGMIARRVAQDAPHRVSALAILHSPHTRSAEAQAAIVKRVEQAKQDGPAATVEAALERWFTDGFRAQNPDMMDLVRGWVTANPIEVYHTIYKVLADGIDEIVAPAPPLVCPTLVITGDEDYGNGPEMSQAIADEIAGSQVHILRGLRHMALAEAPEQINTPLRGFLDRVMSEVEKRALRNAFGTFATGVTVVTTRQPDGTPRGFTANSFTSVSLDPPLVLVCIAKSAHSCDVFASAPHFAINILGEAQKAVSGLFASRAADKFELADWHSGHADMPVLDGSLSRFVCARHDVVDAGDHLVLIGRVEDYGVADSQPLGYFRGSYFSIGLEDPLVDVASAGGTIAIGAVMERDQKVLLKHNKDGTYGVPMAPEGRNSLDGLVAELKASGLTARLDYLYAVYRDSETAHHGIYYHGTVSGDPPNNMAYFALEDIPLDRIQSRVQRSMLARYREEFRHGSFGIYQGDETAGMVHQVAARQPSKH
jgi:(E)-2-((N-methylformamido)methylene)succinate hydrolase